MAAAAKGKWLIVEPSYGDAVVFEGTRKALESELTYLVDMNDGEGLEVWDLAGAKRLVVTVVTEPSITVHYE